MDIQNHVRLPKFKLSRYRPRLIAARPEIVEYRRLQWPDMKRQAAFGPCREIGRKLQPMALDGREAEVSNQRRKDRGHFQHREAHPDADARAGAERHVGAAMARLGFFRREAVWVESVGRVP